METKEFIGPNAQDSPPPTEAQFEAPARRFAPSRKWILPGLLVAGLAVVVVLHFRGSVPAKASASTKETEKRMDGFLKAFRTTAAPGADKKASSVINTFYFEARQRQIPASKLTCNPFRLQSVTGAAAPQESTAASATQPVTDEGEAKELSDALAKLKTLTLQTVMTGSAGATAIISNNFLTLGQKIYGWQVIDIQPRSVTLQWRDCKRTLTMQQ